MAANWHDQRTAFVGGVKAWEWVLVDGVYSNLRRTIPEHEPGADTSDSDVASVKALAKTIPRAQDVVLLRAASKRERDELVAQVGANVPPLS